MPWRYQPVIETDAAGVQVSLCTLHFNEEDRLTGWTNGGRVPCGEDLEGLAGDLTQMMVEAMSWVPVPLDSLLIGMKFDDFERAVDQHKREDIASMIDATKGQFRLARLSVVSN